MRVTLGVVLVHTFVDTFAVQFAFDSLSCGPGRLTDRSQVAEHQRELLDIVYYDDRENRDKFTIILADSIEPKMPAEKYMDKESFENELKQV